MSKELNARCRVLAERISESIHIVDHDPSLALYRLQEHVRKSLPSLVERKYHVAQLVVDLQDGCVGLEDAQRTLKSMSNAASTCDRIHELLRSCTYYKQQLDYERSRRCVPKMPHAASTDSLLIRSRSAGHLLTTTANTETPTNTENVTQIATDDGSSGSTSGADTPT